MADPTMVPCVSGQWTLLAAGVTSARVWFRAVDTGYLRHTYRQGGAAAPADLDDAVLLVPKTFDVEHHYVDYDHGEEIDIYGYALRDDIEVRVDTPLDSATEATHTPTPGEIDVIHAIAPITVAMVHLPDAAGIEMEGFDDLVIEMFIEPPAGLGDDIVISLERQIAPGGAWIGADVLSVRTPEGVPGAVGGWTFLGAGAPEFLMIDAENLNCHAYRLAVTAADDSGPDSYITGRRERRRG